MPVARKNASRKRQRTSEPEDELTGIGNATTCAAPMYDNTWQSNQYVPQAGPSSQPFTGPDESAIPSIPMQEQLPVATQRDSLIDHLLDRVSIYYMKTASAKMYSSIKRSSTSSLLSNID